VKAGSEPSRSASIKCSSVESELTTSIGDDCAVAGMAGIAVASGMGWWGMTSELRTNVAAVSCIFWAVTRVMARDAGKFRCWTKFWMRFCDWRKAGR